MDTYIFAALAIAAAPFSGGIGETIETIQWFVQLGVIIAVGIASVAKTLRDKDELDLWKTLEAANDVADDLKEHLEHEDAPDLEALAEAGAKRVAELRGHSLPPKLHRKAAARVRARLRQK